MQAPLLSARDLGGVEPQPRIIDVREAEELSAGGYIPGAEHVPLAELERAARSWPRHQPLLLVCRSGRRSAEGAALLLKLGFSAVLDLEGGMQAYARLGLPVQRP